MYSARVLSLFVGSAPVLSSDWYYDADRGKRIVDGILECSGLSKTYGTLTALSDFGTEIGSGRIVGLLGPNGSGKTTFIKMAAGLMRPDSGRITIGGYEPGAETKGMVSYLPDRMYLPLNMRVWGALDMFEDFYDDFDRDQAEQMLRRLDIDLSAKVRSMSRGTQEKVQIALIMSRRAKLYLLDEPLSGVDPAARDYILHAIISQYDRSGSILISTHLISDVESILDDVIILSRGRLMLQDSAENIRNRSGRTVDRWFREVFRC